MSPFPTSLDALYDPQPDDELQAPGQPGDMTEVFAALHASIEATQAKVGVNGSSVSTSLDFRVARLEEPTVRAYAATVVTDGTNITVYRRDGTVQSTGTNARQRIQAAIDYVTGIGGGHVFVTAGTYLISTSPIVLSSSVHLRGEGVWKRDGLGFFGTVLKASGTWSGSDAILDSSTNAGCSFSMLCLNGDGRCNGARFQADGCWASEFTAQNCQTTGVLVSGDHCRIRSCITDSNTNRGVDGQNADAMILEDVRLFSFGTFGARLGNDSAMYGSHITTTGSAPNNASDVVMTGNNNRVADTYLDTSGSWSVDNQGTGNCITNNYIKGGPATVSPDAAVKCTNLPAMVLGNRFNAQKRWAILFNTATPAGVAMGNSGTEADDPGGSPPPAGEQGEFGILGSGTSPQSVINDKTTVGTASARTFAAYGNTNAPTKG